MTRLLLFHSHNPIAKALPAEPPGDGGRLVQRREEEARSGGLRNRFILASLRISAKARHYANAGIMNHTKPFAAPHVDCRMGYKHQQSACNNCVKHVHREGRGGSLLESLHGRPSLGKVFEL